MGIQVFSPPDQAAGPGARVGGGGGGGRAAGLCRLACSLLLLLLLEAPYNSFYKAPLLCQLVQGPPAWPPANFRFRPQLPPTVLLLLPLLSRPQQRCTSATIWFMSPSWGHWGSCKPRAGLRRTT